MAAETQTAATTTLLRATEAAAAAGAETAGTAAAAEATAEGEVRPHLVMPGTVAAASNISPIPLLLPRPEVRGIRPLETQSPEILS